MKANQMPDISGLMKAIEVILDPAKAAETAAALKSHVDSYQSLVDRYKEWKSVDNYRDSADSKMAAANAKMSEASGLLAKAQMEAETITKAAVQREFNIDKGLNEREQSVKQRETKVASVQRELDKFHEELVSRETEAKRMRDEAALAMARAQAIQSDYETRLEKLKGLAA